MSDRDLEAVESVLAVVFAGLATVCVIAALVSLGSFSPWAIVFALLSFLSFELYVTLG